MIFHLSSVLFQESRLSSRGVAFDYERYSATRRFRGSGSFVLGRSLSFLVRFPLARGFLL